jgi:hypothetical protein
MTTQSVWDINCTVLALYGIDSRVDVAARFYNTALSWFNDNMLPPNRIAVEGPGFSGKPVAFPKVNKRLQRQGFSGITFVMLVTMWPGGEIPGRDWMLKISWSLDDRYAVVSAESHLVPFRSERFRRDAEEVVRLLQPGYGIAYQMPHLVSPDMYALGIGQQLGTILTGEAYEEAVNRSHWGGSLGMGQSVWQTGIIRDVYPWNFLNAPQLNMEVQGRPLRAWINQDPRRGSLAPVSDTITLWEVPDASIPEIRGQLKDAELLFDWRRYA